MAKKYLDPKADLTFKKVFGEHPDLVISLLNALLPLGDDEQIETIEYLTPELVPDNPLRKYSIVDVRCKDATGRLFIVEMQMVWSKEFMSRVLFNSAKAYVRQLDSGETYHLLQPVYSLNLVNEIFEPELEEYYHYYRLVHELHSERVIDGLHLVFVELPKFKPHTLTEKKMKALWLRYLTEIEDSTREVAEELLENPQISKALTVVEESAYTPEQLEGYDKFWDIIRTERTLVESALRKGMARGMEQGLAKGMEQGLAKGLAKGRAEGMEQGLAEGMEQGLAKGRAEGEIEKAIQIAHTLKKMGLSTSDVMKATGLTAAELSGI